MKLKEFFGKPYGHVTKSPPKTSGRLSDIGTASFRLSLDKEHAKTPMYRIDKVLQMLEDRPNISAGLRQIVLFLINEISIKSDDEKTVMMITEWIEKRPNLKEEIETFAYLWAGAGISYLEPRYKNLKNGQQALDMLYTMPDPSTILRNYRCTDENEDYWLFVLPLEVRAFDGKTANFYPTQYIKGSYMQQEFVWAIPYPKKKFIPLSFGWSRDGFYGQGLLGSAIDNFDIEQEILKNWALVAKYRAMSKKIIGFFSDNDEPVDMTELDRIKDEFMGLEEEDSMLVNRKVISTDLTFNGQDNPMDQEIAYLRRDTGSGLTPNYMTAFSQDSSMATAQEAKIPFSLQLKSMSESLSNFFTQIFREEILPQFPELDQKAEIYFGDPILDSRMDRFSMISQLYNMRIATLNEYRDAAGLTTVEGGDTWADAMPPLDKLSKELDKDPEQMKEHVKEYSKLSNTYKEKLNPSKDVPAPKKFDIDQEIEKPNRENLLKLQKKITELQKQELSKEEFKEAVSGLLNK